MHELVEEGTNESNYAMPIEQEYLLIIRLPCRVFLDGMMHGLIEEGTNKPNYAIPIEQEYELPIGNERSGSVKAAADQSTHKL